MLDEMGTILVTGGAGFVGSALVPEVLRRSATARVAVLDNLFNGRRGHVPDSPRVALHEVDLADGPAVLDVVRRERPGLVLHLAALHFIPYCDAHPAHTLQVNVVGTQNLLDACRTHPPRRLVAVSTVAVYPIRDGANAEDDPAGPVDVYGLSKWANEQQLALFARQVETRCAAARLSNVYGPNETNPHVVPAILDQVLAGRDEIALGNVKPRRDYIYVTDVAKGLLAIAERNEHSCRTYNLGTGREYSVEEIIAQLAEASGRPLRVVVDPARVRQADRMHLLCDMGRTEAELGWRAEHDLHSGVEALWRHAAG